MTTGSLAPRFRHALRPHRRRRVPLAAAAAALALLAGCGSISGTGASSPSAASQLRQFRDGLSNELAGTPVEVGWGSGDTVRVAVPLKFCFEAGRSAVKKPLAAVLDRVAGQLRDKPALGVVSMGPSDSHASATLTQERAAAARDYLVARGVPFARTALGAASSDAALELRVGEPAAH